jgi:hypothetical protein
MRFDQAVESSTTRKDPKTGITSDVKTMVLHVTELNGQQISTIFSVLSQTLQQAFQPYIDAGTLTRYRFTITRGSGDWDAPRIAAAVPV